MWSKCKARRVINSRYCWDHDTDEARKADPEGYGKRTATKKEDRVKEAVKEAAKKDEKGGGPAGETPFRGNSETLQLGPAQQETVEEGSKEVQQAGEAEREAQESMEDLGLIAGAEWGVPDIFRWARSINKKALRSNGKVGDDMSHLEQRREAAKKGIQIVGRI